MLGGTYEPGDIRFATRKLVEDKGGRFIKAHASRIDPQRQVVHLAESGEQVSYDVLSCNAGSYVPKTIVEANGKNVFTSKPIEELHNAKKVILEKLDKGAVSIAVLGSGPAAIEIAGNIHQLWKRSSSSHQARIQIFSGHVFMSGRPARVQKLVRKLLHS